jgi:hypothetical protein
MHIGALTTIRSSIKTVRAVTLRQPKEFSPPSAARNLAPKCFYMLFNNL